VKERAEEQQGGNGGMAIPDMGNPDGYQKKGVAGGAKRIVVKTKGIAKVAQIWARRSGVSGNPGPSQIGVNKSEVEQFEWSLITLVSVARLFYEVNRYLISI
jgi:hypothetical protein